MIFPEQCKQVGYAATKPCGDKVYFLSRYLVRDTGDGYEVLEITPDPAGKGLMRTYRGVQRDCNCNRKRTATPKKCRSMTARDLSGLHGIRAFAARSLPGLTNI